MTSEQQDYFKRVKSYDLKNPLLIGFGISNRSTFEKACQHTNGAIIGSAYIKSLETNSGVETSTKKFVQEIITKKV